MVNLRYFLQVIALSLLFFCNAGQAQIQSKGQTQPQIKNKGIDLNRSKVQISSAISDSIVTPGQLLTLSVSVIYGDKTEVYFSVENVDWQQFYLLSVTEQDPVWKSNSWQKKYQIDLIAPGIGDYQLPTIGFDVYQQDEYQLLTSKAIQLTVKSSYVNAPGNYASEKKVSEHKVPKNSKEQQGPQGKSDKHPQFTPVLQSIELVIDEPIKRTSFLWLALIIVLLLSIAIALGMRQSNRHKKRKQVLLIEQQKTALSPVVSFKNMLKQFENHFEETGKYDWQVVQLWLNEYIIIDPVTKVLTADETALMARYQSLRYAKFQQDKFSSFCIDCYSYLSNQPNFTEQQDIGKYKHMDTQQ